LKPVGGFITYIIDFHRVYTGHGRDTRNIGERIDREARQSNGQVYQLYSLDKRFDKLSASYVEARLIDLMSELAIPLANGVRPFGRDGLTLSPDLEQLVQQAQLLLSVAGFRRFEEARQVQSDRPVRVAATGDLHDLIVLDPETMTVPTDTLRVRLKCPNLQAEGFQVGDRFHVLAGADYCYESKSGLSTDNLARRAAIEALDILERLPGISGRARLRVGLDCKSAAIAGKILSGRHLGNNSWQSVSGRGAFRSRRSQQKRRPRRSAASGRRR